MITQKEIEILNAYAKSLCGDIDGHEDIVQDAIIACIETNTELTIGHLKGAIKLIHQERAGSSLEKSQNFNDHDTTRHCKGCNQDLPTAMFYFLKYKNKNTKNLSHQCKKCTNEYYKKRYKNNPTVNAKRKAEAIKRYERNKLKKLFASKQYLKQAHAILEWRKSA